MTIQKINGIADLFRPMESRFLEFWKELVLAESPSSDKACVDKVGQIAKAFAEELGLSHRTVPFEKAGDGVVIEYNNGSKEAPILLGAHMDTVFEVGEFGENLFRQEGSILYGPGVHDCKSGIVLGIAILYLLKESGYTDRPAKLMLTPDEEGSNTYSGQAGRDFIRREAKGSFCAFNLDGGYEERFIVSRFGILRNNFLIKGVPAHAGVFYDKGRSAIKEAAHKIIALEKESILERMTFNCGTIEGGTVTNVVPEHCKVGIDTRFRDKDAQKEAQEILQRVSDTVFVEDTSCTLESVSFRPCMTETPASLKLAELYVACHKAVTGKDIAITGGSRGGSDASNMAETGLPIIDTVGIIGSLFHTKQEWADSATLLPRAEIITQAIHNLPKSL
ncbi:MAG: M20 family metallopeptidase [Ruminococcaceae bacterium]|nr:M20 family metallopeptidase [Oscillospiraceae bacterium]